MIVQLLIGFQDGGAVSRRARQEVQALLQIGHRVTIISDAREAPDPFARAYPDRFRLISIWPRCFRPVRYRLPGEPLYALRVAGTLNRIARHENIQLLVSHKATLLWATSRVTRALRIPTAFVIHGVSRDQRETRVYRDDPLTLRLYSAAERRVFRQVDHFIPVSQYVGRLVVAEGAPVQHVHVVPNPIDTERFRPATGTPKAIDVLYIGRLSPEKGVGVLVRAARGLPAGVSLVVVGDGPLRHRLHAEAQRFGVAVRFTGWLPNDCLPQVIQQAKVLVVPSFSDSFPSVVLEAMACGVPVIGSDVGGIPEMIEPGHTGWLVPPGDEDALTGALREALDDESRREALGLVARHRVEVFSLERFQQRISELYRTLTERAS